MSTVIMTRNHLILTIYQLLYIDIPCEEELILLGGKESSSYLYIIQCQKSEFKVEIAYGNLTNNSQMSH